MKQFWAILLAIIMLLPACKKTIPGDPSDLPPDNPPDEVLPSVDDLLDEEGDAYSTLTADTRAKLDSIYQQKVEGTQAFAEVPAATGTTWYVSSIHGNDSYSGKSPDRAWKTTANCASKVGEGDTILFECGSVFRRTKNDYFIRGMKNNVTLATYGEGAKPIFYGSINVPASAWKQVGNSNIYYVTGSSIGISNLNIDNDIGTIVFNEGEAWGIKTLMTFSDTETKQNPKNKTLALEGVSNGLTTVDIPSYDFTGGADLKGDLSFYHDYSQKRVYLYCKGGSPGTRFSSIEFSLNMFAFSTQSPAKNLTFLNLDFRNYGSHVIRTMNCENLTVKNCSFRFVGGSIQKNYGTWRDYYTRLGNAVENWNACNGMVVENCFFDQIYDTAMTTQSNDSVASKNITYRNNVAQNVWFGIELWTVSSGVEFSNVDVSGNYFAKIGEGLTSQRPDKNEYGYSINAFIKCSSQNHQMSNFSVTENVADGTNGKMVFCLQLKTNQNPEGVLFDRNVYVASTDVDFARFFGKKTADGTTYAFTAKEIAEVQQLGVEKNGKFYYYESKE